MSASHVCRGLHLAAQSRGLDLSLGVQQCSLVGTVLQTSYTCLKSAKPFVKPLRPPEERSVGCMGNPLQASHPTLATCSVFWPVLSS